MATAPIAPIRRTIPNQPVTNPTVDKEPITDTVTESESEPAGRQDSNSPPNPTATAPPDAPTAPVRGPVRMQLPKSSTSQTARIAPRPISGATFQLQSIEDEVDKPTKVLIYGPPGVGKTWLAGSATLIPSMRDLFWIDAEGGRETIRNRKGIDFASMTTYEQLAKIYEFLRLHCRYRDANDSMSLARLEIKFRGLADNPLENESYKTLTDILGHEPRRYNTVVGDSLSEFARYCLYMMQGVTPDWALDIPPDAPEWIPAQDLVRLMVRQFRNLPMHVIFVSAENMTEDKDKNKHSRPNLSGKLASEVQGFFDCVGYMRDTPANDEIHGNRLRRLYITPGKEWEAKNRFVHHPEVRFIDNPTMQNILDLTHE